MQENEREREREREREGDTLQKRIHWSHLPWFTSVETQSHVITNDKRSDCVTGIIIFWGRDLDEPFADEKECCVIKCVVEFPHAALGPRKWRWVEAKLQVCWWVRFFLASVSSDCAKVTVCLKLQSLALGSREVSTLFFNSSAAWSAGIEPQLYQREF